MRSRKLLAMFLAFVMLVSMVPVTIFAAEAGSGTDPDNLYLDKNVVLTDDGTYDINLEAYATSGSTTDTFTVTGLEPNTTYYFQLAHSKSGNFVMGRSYTHDNQTRYETEGKEASKWGYNFAEQFNYALEIDPKVIFVTGWNEWTAGRHQEWGGVENAFPDQFIDEFSRDIEPTKGALQDHYYYQLVNFVRQYKGANPIPTPSLNATIDLSAGQAQWKDVAPYYGSYANNVGDRKSSGYGNLKYTETSGRNDIIGAKVARDGEFVYFLVECNENITPYTDSLWMNLYIDTNQNNQGWNTFEYVVNKTAASEKTLVLEKFTADNDYSKTEKVADVEYKVDGKYMTVKIPKTALGLSGNDYTVNFAWTDNVHDEGDYDKFSGDILDFYISGDVAPGGRFKFSYVSTNENATGEKSIRFGFGHNFFMKFPEEGYSDLTANKRADGNFYDAAISADWCEEKKLRIRVQIIDKYFGNLGIVFGFKNENEVSVRMSKTAEDFLSEYCGVMNAAR